MKFKPFRRNTIDWLMAIYMWVNTSFIAFSAIWVHTHEWLIVLMGCTIFAVGGFVLVEDRRASE